MGGKREIVKIIWLWSPGKESSEHTNKNLCRYSKSHKKEMKLCQRWCAARLSRICAACNFWEEKSGSIISYKAQIFSFKSPLHPQETTLSFFLLIHSTRISLSSTQIHSGKELNTKCWTLFKSFFSFSYKTNKTLGKRTWNKPLGIRQPQKKSPKRTRQGFTQRFLTKKREKDNQAAIIWERARQWEGRAQLFGEKEEKI